MAHCQTARSADRSHRGKNVARRNLRAPRLQSIRSHRRLEIFPPETLEANDTKATVSDRTNTVFDLPLKPETGLVSLANLPRTVNELRDPTLIHLNIPALRGISIQPATGTEILVSRNPPQPWMTTIDGVSAEATEENLYALLKAVTTNRAIGFVSDAAADFTPYSRLDKGPNPFLLDIGTTRKLRSNCSKNRQSRPQAPDCFSAEQFIRSLLNPAEAILHRLMFRLMDVTHDCRENHPE